jgi:hypothetical protein
MGQQPSAEVTGLPVGEAVLYACAVDEAGSELCHFQDVNITQPESFDANRALASFSLADATVATPEALAASSQMFAALVATAAGSSNVDEEGGETNLAVFSKEAQDFISMQASNLITLLARDLSVQDSDGAQEVLANVATVAATAGELLSTEAKQELLDVAKQSELRCLPRRQGLLAACWLPRLCRGLCCLQPAAVGPRCRGC